MTTLNLGGNTGNTGGCQDTHLAEEFPGSPQGAQTSAYVKNQTFSAGVSGIGRALFKWSGLPAAGAIVSDAYITFYTAAAIASPRSISVREVLSAWNAATATWLNRDTGVPWALAGALGGADIDADVIATGTIPTATATAFTVTGAGLIALAQAWIDGTAANNGVMVSITDEATISSIASRVRTTEYATNGQRPVLTIVYSLPTTPDITVDNISVNNLSGNAVLTVTLSSDALAGGVSGTVNTADITAIAGVDYTAQTGVPFSIPEGQSSGTIIVPIAP